MDRKQDASKQFGLPTFFVAKNRTETLMKKSLVALVALLPIAQAANAEGLSVTAEGAKITLYGTLDIGFWSQSKATSDVGPQTPGPVSAGSLKKFHSGGISPSKWGLTGTKDLGDGITGFFKIEEHIRSNTGDTEAFGISGFVRETYVGAQGDFGTVKVGRQFTPAILSYAATDPRGLRESLSGMNSWLASGGLGTTFLSAFASNSISYNTSLAGLNVGALYSAGGKVGNADADSTLSLGVSYSGPVTVSGSYENESRADNGEKGVVKSSIGFAIPVGPLSLKANYLSNKTYDATGTQVTDHELTGAGFDWKVNDKNSVNLSYYQGKDKKLADNKANTLVVSDEFAWNPSTTLYAQAAYIDAKSNADAVVSLLGNGSLVQGAKTTVFNAGVRFNF